MILNLKDMFYKINFFLRLYNKEEEIYNFVFAKYDDPDYRSGGSDILIQNNKFFFLQIDNELFYFCDEKKDYVL